MTPWTEPRIEWHRGTDSVRHYQYLVNGAELLTRWEPAPFEISPTDCFRLGDAFWIWQPGVGGIQFNAAEPAVNAFPSDTVDSAWFEHLIERSWMPAVYQAWGRQVLHASAVAEKGSGRVVAFTGPSGAGNPPWRTASVSVPDGRMWPTTRWPSPSTPARLVFIP